MSEKLNLVSHFTVKTAYATLFMLKWRVFLEVNVLYLPTCQNRLKNVYMNI